MADQHPGPERVALQQLRVRKPQEQNQTEAPQHEQLKAVPRQQRQVRQQQQQDTGGEAFESQKQVQRREGEKRKEERLQEERLGEEKQQQQSHKEQRQQEDREGASQRKMKDMQRHRSLRWRAKETLEKHLGAMQVVSPIDPFPTAPRRETEVLALEKLPPDLTEKVAAELSRQRKKRIKKGLVSRTKSSPAAAAPGSAAAIAATAPGSAAPIQASAAREGKEQKEDEGRRRGEKVVEEEKKGTTGQEEEQRGAFNVSLPSSFFSSGRMSLGGVERCSAAPDGVASVSTGPRGLSVGRGDPQQLVRRAEKKGDREGGASDRGDDAGAVETKSQAAAASAARDVEDHRPAGGGEGGAPEEGEEGKAAAAPEGGRGAAAGEEAVRGGAEAVAGRGTTAAAAERAYLLRVRGDEEEVGPAKEQQECLRQDWQRPEQKQSHQQVSAARPGARWQRYYGEVESAGGAAAAAAGSTGGGSKTAFAVGAAGGAAMWNSRALEEGRRSSSFAPRREEEEEEVAKGKCCFGVCWTLLSALFAGRRRKARKDESCYLSPGGDTCSVCTRRSRFSFFSRDERFPTSLGGGGGGGVAGTGTAGGRLSEAGEKRRSGSSFYFMTRLFPHAASEYSAPPMMAARLQATPCGVNRFVLLGIYVLYALLTGRVYFAWPNISNLLFRSEAYLWLCGEDGAGQQDLRLPEHGSRRYACEEQNARVQQLFVVCLASAYACALLAGLLLDKVGPKLTALFGQCCNCAAWLLLAGASRTSQTYFPAFVVMGVGVDSGYMALLSVANLFPGHEGLVVATLGSAKSLSFAMPTILDAIEANNPSIKLRDVSLAYAALGPGLCFFIAVFLVNFRPFLPWTSFIHIEEVMEEMEQQKRQRAGGWTDVLLLRSPSISSVFSAGKRSGNNVLAASCSTGAAGPFSNTCSSVLHPRQQHTGGGDGSAAAAAGAAVSRTGTPAFRSRADYRSPSPAATTEGAAALREGEGKGGGGGGADLQKSSGEIGTRLSVTFPSGSTVTAAAAARAAGAAKEAEEGAAATEAAATATAEAAAAATEATAAATEAAAAAAEAAVATGEAGAAAEAAAASGAAAAAAELAAAATEVAAAASADAAAAAADAVAATKEVRRAERGREEEEERKRAAAGKGAAAAAANEALGRGRGGQNSRSCPVTRNPDKSTSEQHSKDEEREEDGEEGRKPEEKETGKGGLHSGDTLGACSPPYRGGSFLLKMPRRTTEEKEKGSEAGGGPCSSNRSDELAAPTLWQQLTSKYCLLMMGSYVCQAILYPFLSTSAEELFGKDVNDFLGVALPFSCVACLIYGRLTDMYGIMRVLLLLHTTITLVYVLSLLQQAVASYVAATLLVIYVGFYSSQVYCFVNDTFAAAQFGRIVGVTFMAAGFFSLLKIPLHTLVVHVFHSKYTWPVVIMLALCLFNYFLLGLLCMFKRKNAHPFWPQEAAIAAAVKAPSQELLHEQAPHSYSPRHV